MTYIGGCHFVVYVSECLKYKVPLFVVNKDEGKNVHEY